MPIESIRNVLLEHVNRIYERDDGVRDWQKAAEIPTAAEILGSHERSGTGWVSDHRNTDDSNGTNDPILPSNIIDRPWHSIGAYVGVHYQLLREDAVAPLRDAVSVFRSQPTMNDNQQLSIYTHVYIVGITFSNLGPAFRVEFSCERAGKRIRWQQSKRLQQGTIVALSPIQDKFKTICKIAVVAARPLQGVEHNPHQIDLFWGDPNEAEFDPLQQYFMVEAKSGYFEASRHMLVAMQKLMTESFPLSEHLVYLEKSIRAPEFIEKKPLTNLNSLKRSKEKEDAQSDVEQLQIDDDDPLANVNILGYWPQIAGTKLDKSQMTALRRILTKNLAVVQGPPGTGKTFVSISALIVMLENFGPGDPPIIVAAQTNHALDQLLRIIAQTEPNFLRIGGRTSDENTIIKDRTLYEVRNKTRTRGVFRNNFKNAKVALDASSLELQLDVVKALRQGNDEVQDLLEWKIITQDQFDSLQDDDWVIAQDPDLPPGILPLWLGREQLAKPPRCPAIDLGFGEDEGLEYEVLEEAEAEFLRKDDDDTLTGKWFPLKEVYTGATSPGYSDVRMKKLLESKSNLWEIEPMLRGEVYRYLKRRLKVMVMKGFREHLMDYQQRTRNLKIARWESDATLIKNSGIKLIGCTTTGLSKYRGLLASLQPRTMLIEEAAETLEGTILAAMFSSLQQLILVGDHQQLQAHCNVAALENAPYNLAVSMFERLVSNGIEYTILNKQRRMISEIRQLLDPFYPNLQDHASVLDRLENRLPIPGMGGRDSYFFHHQWPESRDDFLSRFNIHEADMIAGFFTYLVLNGMEPSQITVLTFYSGQRKIVLQRLRKQPELANHGQKFNVFTVDSYQGEENDVIILSLVRSNLHHNIGFLENKNRAVVSLSRARRGMYIFGNAINLLAANTQSFDLWSSVTDCLKRQKRLDINSGFPIVCQNHKVKTIIYEPADWMMFSGGCTRKCHGKLLCGHTCIFSCHPFSHEDILCKEPCRRALPCGHNCTQRCGDVCKCVCDKVTPVQNIADQSVIELWQSSLDDLLGDSTVNTELESRSRKAASGIQKSADKLSLSSAESSPRKWRDWDASAADRTLREIQAASEQTSGATTNSPVLIDTHREVTIRNNARIKVVKPDIATVKAITSMRLTSALQSHRNHEGSTLRDCNMKAVTNLEAQPVKTSQYLDSDFVEYPLSLGPKSIPSPKLQLSSINLSGPASKISLSNRTAPVARKTTPDLTYLRGAEEDASSKILEDAVDRYPWEHNFGKLTIESSDDEEDLMTFD